MLCVSTWSPQEVMAHPEPKLSLGFSEEYSMGLLLGAGKEKSFRVWTHPERNASGRSPFPDLQSLGSAWGVDVGHVVGNRMDLMAESSSRKSRR